ncbi:MAG TPA: N-6 DNA methylase [Allosphingosinicella sp.]|nr:N-6 DNA methylase [Allosphingosinicella sp.]
MTPLSSALTSAEQLSVFYTPASTAACLASWAIRSGRERVLEPSFGGGALIDAAISRSIELTGENALSLVAFDLDPKAIFAISKRAVRPSVAAHWCDFLNVKPTEFEKFDAILSNPPFTRNHAIPPVRRAELRTRFDVSGAAGLWVHFLLHSTSFLRRGGRLACVVPASALFTIYGAELLRRLCDRFLSVEILRLNERPQWVGSAEEAGAFLLAEGFDEGSCAEPARGFWVEGRGPMSDFEGASASFAKLALASRPLGELAELSIGAVTGCNRTFLLSEKERVDLGIARADVSPIVSRARHLRGVLITKRGLKELAAEGEKTWLLTPRSLGRLGSPIRGRLATINASQRRKTAWFNKRDPWWKVDQGPECDAVFSYMNDQGPRLARVTPGLSCTNTLHRVIFRPDTTERDQTAALLSMVSTFGQLAGERIGRVYGGGVLKFELRDARQLPVLPLADAVDLSVLQDVDAALRSGEPELATDLADEALFPPVCGKGWRTAVSELACELRVRRQARRGGKGR